MHHKSCVNSPLTEMNTCLSEHDSVPSNSNRPKLFTSVHTHTHILLNSFNLQTVICMFPSIFHLHGKSTDVVMCLCDVVVVMQTDNKKEEMVDVMKEGWSKMLFLQGVKKTEN